MTTAVVFDILARDRASDKFDHVGKSAGGASAKLKKFAAVGAAAVAAGAFIAGKALVGMAKGAIEDAKGQAILAKTLQNTTGANRKQIASVEDWITAQGKALGVADDDLRPAYARLAEATGDVGKAQKLASLAMNISAGTGKSLKTVSEALAKAQMGQVSGLSRYGIETRNAAGEVMSFDEVTKRASKTFAGQATTAANTLEGKMGRLKLMYDETKESIGAKLIPVAEKLATLFMTKVVPAAQKVGQWFSEKLGPPLRDLAEKAGPAAQKVMTGLQDAFKDARPFIDMVGKVLSNVVIPGLGKLMQVAGPLLVNQLKLLGKTLGLIGEAGQWMWEKVLKPVFSKLLQASEKAANMLAGMLDAMSKAPGMGWAEKAADKLRKVADGAAAADRAIRGIPSYKRVTVDVQFMMPKKKPVKHVEDTDDWINDLAGASPRMVARVQSNSERVMDALTTAFGNGGKKIKKLLGDNLKNLRESLASARDEIKSFSESIAMSINQTDFSSLESLTASLNSNGANLSGLSGVFAQLKGSVSKGFLSSLMESGNTEVATQLGSNPALAAQLSNQFDTNAAMAKGLGDQTATTVLGDRMEKAFADGVKKLIDELKEAPGKQAKKLRKEIEGIQLKVTGLEPGRKAHLMGAW